MYPPMVSDNSMMSLEKFGASSSSQNRLPIVRAVTFLRKDATSEIIDLNKFPEKCTSIAKYVSIFDFSNISCDPFSRVTIKIIEKQLHLFAR